MGTVAKSSITLVSISDAYSLSLTPNSCVIKADFDGSNPKLEHAYTIISAYCGDEKTPIEIDSSTIVKSNDNIEYQLIKVDSYRYRLSIISLPIDILQGYIEIPVLSGVSTGLTGRFTFSIVRESTMLDWIQDWESNKTTIGSSYVITPKLFVGKKIIGSYDSLEDVPGLTGVYIGPSENNGAGIYGYKDNKEIFHIDQTGGKIGGWDITSGGIQCEDGTLSIKSEGTISAQSEGIIHWLLNKDGSASFANGNVTMDVEGNALFKGTIETSGGSIAGWTIGVDSIYNGSIGINSLKKFIAIANVASVQDIGNQLDWVKEYGGVAMYCISNTNYGLIGYKNNEKVFSAGSDNFIAGWNFNEKAIFSGIQTNSGFTTKSGDITISSNGIRGFKWRLEKDGSGALAGDNITWDKDGNMNFKGKIDASQIISGKIDTSLINTDAILSNGDAWALLKDGSGYLASKNLTWDEFGNINVLASLSLPYKEFYINTDSTPTPMDLSQGRYFIARYGNIYGDQIIELPTPIKEYNGSEIRIYSGFMTTRASRSDFDIIIKGNGIFFYPGYIPVLGSPIQISKVRVSNKEIILRCISLGDFVFWYIQNFCDFTNDDFNPQ
ncbi:hypothetical protein [Bacteroides thetaiotaomicron]|uniref:hypothetical protein n=2 Tax=Bacteroides thetaiotaomicron TaxID=818 RepID=UPI002030E9CC|nr:hypothetical protein [Bacteroides thetaiotaomicron]MCM1657088.1 hypothetical protein [Bacteroides thetaiotaomicron]MCM1658670.1 hypothetical protein [Bacteroides thetaiotaomicron]MCM1695414.1 hypothetical protein [Bacteroides thetaiotaomicron]MCM1711058.1 hypothetical protein [Bacteroides thetaiotaomicron]MCM1795510.1 hypothetical protein [Bacteroides thetaiotaomicron]